MSPEPSTSLPRGDGRTALVTGGNRGIGLGLVEGLAKLGFRVWLGSRDPMAGYSAALPFVNSGLNVKAVELDVTLDPSVAKAAKTMGRIDVLVNNAAVFEDQGVLGLDVAPEIVKRTLDINTIGALRVIQAFAPGMRERQWGRIVNVSSDMGAGQAMRQRDLAYRLSKLALNGVTRILADELSGSGVKVNAVHPGWVQTQMGGPNAHRTVAECVDGVLWAATLPDNGPTGGYFLDRKPLVW